MTVTSSIDDTVMPLLSIYDKYVKVYGDPTASTKPIHKPVLEVKPISADLRDNEYVRRYVKELRKGLGLAVLETPPCSATAIRRTRKIAWKARAKGCVGDGHSPAAFLYKRQGEQGYTTTPPAPPVFSEKLAADKKKSSRIVEQI